jgi:hypothetical protein
MLIKNCVQNDDGSLNFEFFVDRDEAAFLMDYAVKDLIHFGIISVKEQEDEQQISLFPNDGDEVH